MKLILSLTLIWALCSSAGALDCQTCVNTGCSTPQSMTCTTQTKCLTATIQTTISGTTVTQIAKGCAVSALCPNSSSAETTSSNFGAGSTIASAKCCSTDNCNTETLTIPPQTNNSLQCLACNANGSDCSTKLQCMGQQDRCFKANFTVGNISVPLFGCVSENVCTSLSNQNSLLLQNITGGNFTSGPSCCSTNLCNTVFSTSDACCLRLSVLHLLLGLLVFSLY